MSYLAFQLRHVYFLLQTLEIEAELIFRKVSQPESPMCDAMSPCSDIIPIVCIYLIIVSADVITLLQGSQTHGCRVYDSAAIALRPCNRIII